MIVEDGKWEREGLRDFLDWTSLGIEVAGCASNGVEGVRLAELYRPEIILTDIMMPIMDGIQMSQNIRAFLPDSKIIILSGYNDFQYAKQSFSFHAFDYIMKPIEKKSLEQVILSVLLALNHEESMNKEMEVLKSQWTDYVRENRSHLLLNILECKTELDYVSEIVPISGIKLHKKIVIAVLSFRSTSLSYNQEVINTIGRMLNERGMAFSFSKPFKEAVLCMNAPATQTELEAELQQLSNWLKKELDIEVIIGVGEVAKDFAGAPQSYSQAKEASSFCFLAEYGDLLFYDRIKETDFKDIDKTRPLILNTYGIIKKILYSIQRKRMDECSLLVDDFLSALKETGSISKLLLGKLFTEAMSGLNSVHAQNARMGSSEVLWDKNRFDTDFSSMESRVQTKQYLMELLTRIAAHSANKISSNEDEVAQKVLGIIKERYADALDLKSISEEIHLTPYYIGSIFKKYTGKPFNQYLNEYRIDKAKEIFETRKITVAQLANEVGIQNSSYFCLLFKNRFGVSPGDYKDILR